MTDWSKALEEMAREEPRLYRRLFQDRPFNDELQAELERCGVGKKSLKPEKGKEDT